MKYMYAILNKKEGNYLNYASKRKRLFRNRINHYYVHSPFPTLRPKEHIKKHFIKWINNTHNPEDYKIVCFIRKFALQNNEVKIK